MARFNVRRLHFGKRPDADSDDDGEGLPTPARVKLAARQKLKKLYPSVED